MFNYIVWIIKKFYYRFTGFETYDGTYAYRKYLFDELCEIYGLEFFKNKRILEIGPKDGEDTFRLQSLNPSEIVMFDLPDKTLENNKQSKVAPRKELALHRAATHSWEPL